MKRLTLETPPRKDPHFYSTTFNDRCGFMVLREGPRRLLWITFNGTPEFFPCLNLTELLGVLERPEVASKFAEEWNRESGGEGSFDDLWRTVIADVRERCGAWDVEREEIVPERVKKQLLWAFDSSGKLDGDRFVTILKYERVHLSAAQLAELASELTARPRTFWLNPN